MTSRYNTIVQSTRATGAVKNIDNNAHINTERERYRETKGELQIEDFASRYCKYTIYKFQCKTLSEILLTCIEHKALRVTAKKHPNKRMKMRMGTRVGTSRNGVEVAMQRAKKMRILKTFERQQKFNSQYYRSSQYKINAVSAQSIFHVKYHFLSGIQNSNDFPCCLWNFLFPKTKWFHFDHHNILWI